jgi:hypothetical protein
MDDALRVRFSGAGYAPDDAVEAFSGAYPFFGGYTNVGQLFTRRRLLALSGAKLSVWSAFTGPTPIRQLLVVPLSSLVLDSFRPYGYDRWIVGQRHFWIKQTHRATLTRWLADSQV